MSDFLLLLAGVNVMVAAAVVVVMVLRLPARRLFGARIAYGLWSLAPLAGLALLLPRRVVVQAAPAAAEPSMLSAPFPVAPMTPPAFDPGSLALTVWIVGGLASLAWLAWRQHQFGRAVRGGRAGPAVVGVLKPRIVTPDDFDGLYSPRERQVVLAHERAHIERHDAFVNATVALARCAGWFNPMIHVLAHYLRIDQELACDAQVVAAYPQARRAYAEAMLKTQLAARPLPLGCYWPAQAAHPLADRIRLLTRAAPGRPRRLAGTLAVALLGLGAVGSAWAAKPAQIVIVPGAPRIAAPAPDPAPPAADRRAPVPAAKVRPARSPDATDAAAAPQPAAPATELAAIPASAPAAEAAPQAEPSPWAWTRARTRPMRPLIEPGSAVRVVASTVDPDGVALSSDMTSFGSNPLYRTGSYRRAGSRYGLYTSVFQHGDRYWITASLTHDRQQVVAGSVAVSAGETGEIQLANGQVVRVTATSRPETAEETASAEAAGADASTVYAAARERTRAYRPPRPAAPQGPTY